MRLTLASDLGAGEVLGLGPRTWSDRRVLNGACLSCQVTDSCSLFKVRTRIQIGGIPNSTATKAALQASFDEALLKVPEVGRKEWGSVPAWGLTNSKT